jgi:hypothetical protein
MDSFLAFFGSFAGFLADSLTLALFDSFFSSSFSSGGTFVLTIFAFFLANGLGALGALRFLAD